MFENLKLTDNAKIAQYEVRDYMQSLGYKCILEYGVKDRYDGNSGRIDIVCFKNNETIAIEVDNKKPRKKSIYKLENFNANKKYVICRNGKNIEVE